MNCHHVITCQHFRAETALADVALPLANVARTSTHAQLALHADVVTSTRRNTVRAHHMYTHTVALDEAALTQLALVCARIQGSSRGSAVGHSFVVVKRRAVGEDFRAHFAGVAFCDGSTSFDGEDDVVNFLEVVAQALHGRVLGVAVFAAHRFHLFARSSMNQNFLLQPPTLSQLL